MVAPASARPTAKPGSGAFVRPRRWWASTTYGATRPVRRVGALAALGAVSGVGEAAVVICITALVFTDQPASYPLVDRLPSSTWTLAGLTLAALAALAIAHLLSAVLAARTGAEVQRTVQARLVTAYLDAPWSAQARTRTGELQELATVKAAMLAFGTQEGAHALAAAINLLIVMVAAVLLSVWATIALLLSVALVLAFSRPLRKRRHAAALDSVRVGTALATEITETALSARDVRVFGVTGAARDALVDRIDELAARNRTMRTLAAATPPLTRDATVAVLTVGLAAVVTGTDIALPLLGASMILVLRSLSHAQALAAAGIRLQEREAHLHQIEERLVAWRSPLAPGRQRCPRAERIELRDVNYRYPEAGEMALEAVSIVVARGERVGIVGRTGAGKSTLASVLLGLLAPDDGAVLVDGVGLGDILPSDWHERTAWVGQDPRLLTGTVADNIRFLRPGLDDEAVRAAALAAGLGPELARWPGGLAHPAGPGGASLSSGERQRVALARALAGQPDLLVLDEPTSALDAHTEAAIRRVLESLEHTALVVIAHRLSTVRACDRIAVMQAGRLVRVAPPDELALTDDWFREALDITSTR